MEERKRIRLEDLERKHPFKVPEGYFEDLTDKIHERVAMMTDQEDNEVALPEIRTKIFRSWWSFPAVAASLALIAALIWFTFPVRQGPLGPDTLSAVSDEAILEYLASQDLDYFDLASQDVVQKAFLDESTLMQYLDGVDEELIREQLKDESGYEEFI